MDEEESRARRLVCRPERAWQGIASEAGPWAIDEYLQSPLDSRFIQSFKSVAASPLFERATVFGKPFRFEDMGRLFLQRLVAHAGGRLDQRPRRVIVGRPVEYAGARADPALARQRYDAMLGQFGIELFYVHEPLGAAHSYASRLTEPATILVAEALDATRAAGLRIVPECSMVSGYIAKHPEYAPLVDPA